MQTFKSAMPEVAGRKIVQIATSAASNGHSLYALCDDGTLWDYDWTDNWDSQRGKYLHAWKPMAAIPQPESATPAEAQLTDSSVRSTPET